MNEIYWHIQQLYLSEQKKREKGAGIWKWHANSKCGQILKKYESGEGCSNKGIGIRRQRCWMLFIASIIIGIIIINKDTYLHPTFTIDTLTSLSPSLRHGNA